MLIYFSNGGQCALRPTVALSYSLLFLIPMKVGVDLMPLV